MDLGLGVLEEKRGDGGVRGGEEVDDGSEDGRENEGGLRASDVLGTMMGKKRSRRSGKAGIEEVGGG